jgi:hypothetical protein
VRTSAVAPVAVLLACAALFAAGCGGGSGSSGSSTAPAGSKVVSCEVAGGATAGLRATAIDCGTARATMRRWARERSCAMAEGASRGSCALGGFRCQAVRSGRGAAVSCARPGADIAFLVKAWPLKQSGAG